MYTHNGEIYELTFLWSNVLRYRYYKKKKNSSWRQWPSFDRFTIYFNRIHSTTSTTRIHRETGVCGVQRV